MLRPNDGKLYKRVFLAVVSPANDMERFRFVLSNNQQGLAMKLQGHIERGNVLVGRGSVEINTTGLPRWFRFVMGWQGPGRPVFTAEPTSDYMHAHGQMADLTEGGGENMAMYHKDIEITPEFFLVPF